ncbi:hypothetical protein COLO4_21691 [Corchorus olitorius]|uniref:Uncharacterized protein n=1 Tax=Corchorus olitorius TaxID=93759 RepID=A0A1R3IRM3_9ROSI|nr:hypothetical protein COLO4_21691 [Corchorus olitorius]
MESSPVPDEVSFPSLVLSQCELCPLCIVKGMLSW